MNEGATLPKETDLEDIITAGMLITQFLPCIVCMIFKFRGLIMIQIELESKL